MPRKDTIHDAVKNALVKDGWNITHEPYIIKYGDERVLIDLAAELHRLPLLIVRVSTEEIAEWIE